jgi:hypothetical protein
MNKSQVLVLIVMVGILVGLAMPLVDPIGYRADRGTPEWRAAWNRHAAQQIAIAVPVLMAGLLGMYLLRSNKNRMARTVTNRADLKSQCKGPANNA